MLTSAFLRERYGKVFVTTFPDGLRVPWKPLSLSEHTYYHQLIASQRLPSFVVENEIFKKQVVDKSVFKDANLKAGVVSTVAACILSFSGPSDPQGVQSSLDFAREKIQSSMLHEFVSVICMAFPAYTPDDIYNMEYSIFMDRLALAENKLLATGVLSEPISVTDDSVKKAPKKTSPVSPEKLKEIYESRQFSNTEKRAISSVVSPPDSSNQQTIIDKKEMAELTMSLTGQERQNLQIAGHEFIKNVANDVYAPYIEQMKKGEKVRIMTPEERISEMEKREKKSKELYEKKKKDIQQAIKKLENRKHDRVLKFRKKRGV